MGRPISKTTTFILSLPRDLPAKQVLAKAKASGHKTSESNVHRVRRLHGGKKGGGKKGVAKKVASASAGTASVGTKALTKSEFIRSVPATVSAKDVVAKAKAAGMKLDIQYVYKLRSRSKPGRKSVAVARPQRAVIAKTKTNGSHSSTEDLLRAVAAELGLGHAVEILQSLRAQARAVIGN